MQLEPNFTLYYNPCLFGVVGPTIQAFTPTDKDKLNFKNIINKIDLSGKELIDVILYSNADALKTSLGIFEGLATTGDLKTLYS